MSETVPDARPIALTMGDPAGIGGEITLRAAAARKTDPSIPPFIAIDDAARLAAMSARMGLGLAIVSITDPATQVPSDTLAVLDCGISVPNRPGAGPGRPDAGNAPAVVASIKKAVELAQSGICSAVVTNPIHKKSLYEAGFAYPGHTEFLGALSAGEDAARPHKTVMMLEGAGLRVVPVTGHVSLKEAIDRLDSAAIIQTAHMVAHALSHDFGIATPRLAIAGLNPHAGEDGAMGREDVEIITPAIARLRSEGFFVTGPHPADTMFHERARSRYDVAICMYHDQALIPVKTLAFDTGVNITLGLDFIRTSPDHGTAFDIAGKWVAKPDSLIAALKTASAMARTRQERKAA